MVGVIIAAIGFAFDIYELLMLPLIVRSALLELGGIAPGTPSEFARARETYRSLSKAFYDDYVKRLLTAAHPHTNLAVQINLP